MECRETAKTSDENQRSGYPFYKKVLILTSILFLHPSVPA